MTLSDSTQDFVNYIILDRSYVGFKEAIAFKESQGKYTVVNSLGYLGKYQFGASTLKLIGISNSSSFLKNPKLQEKAFWPMPSAINGSYAVILSVLWATKSMELR